MSVLSPALASPGPLQWMQQGIQERVQVGFPPAYFDFAIMPQKADRAWFKQVARRTSLVALGWNGSVAEGNGKVFGARAHWSLALVVKNPVVEARYMGDALSPGLFAMARVATLLLHGYLIDPASTPWCAQGTIEVRQIGNVYNDEWGDENAAVVALDLSVLYEETPPPGLEEEPGASLNLNNLWNFGEQPPLFPDLIGAA